jgi:lactoylglutathione lyase
VSSDEVVTEATVRVGEIHHVVVSVQDLERALDFYEGALGLRRTLVTDVGGPQVERLLGLPEGTVGRSAYLQGPSRIGQVELVEWTPARPDPTPPKRLAEPGISVLAFAVASEQLPPMYQRLAAHGYEPVARPETSVLEGYGPIGAFLVADPDGNLVEIVSLPSDEEIRAHRAG